MIKPLWTAEEICAATHSSLCSIKSWKASGIAINSKEVQKGDLFIALKGEKVDSHNFLEEAFERGAVAAVVEYAPATNHSFVVVRQSREAILDIGRAARNRLAGTIIGVTGSAGKTSTKDMLALCLKEHGKTFATKRSFNSTITAPLSLASADPTINYGVFEIGMNKPGEIAEITKIVRPHIGIITNIAPAHLQNFASVETIAQEKASLFLGLPSNGTAIIPGDSAHAMQLKEIAQKTGVQNILSFGESAHCDARLVKSFEEKGRFHHTVDILGETCTFSMAMPGKHWAYNALVCLLVAKLTNNSLQKTCKAIETYAPSERRGVAVPLKNNMLLVDESYNANPLSMQMALESFGLRSCSGKKVAVLGDMLELGPDSPKLHAALATTLKKAGVSVLITHGDLMQNLHNALKDDITSYHCKTLDGVEEKLFKTLQVGDAIMVKSSLGMGFIQIINALTQKFLGT